MDGIKINEGSKVNVYIGEKYVETIEVAEDTIIHPSEIILAYDTILRTISHHPVVQKTDGSYDVHTLIQGAVSIKDNCLYSDYTSLD